MALPPLNSRQAIENPAHRELSPGKLFGYARSPSAMIDTPSQFDSYSGGGLDIPPRRFCEIDRLNRETHRQLRKFVDQAEQITFSCPQAMIQGEEIHKVTERAVFRAASLD